MNETRLNKIQENAQWLLENADDADKFAIAKRLGLIKGDVNGLIQELSEL